MVSDKIKQIMAEKGLSPSHFADAIGVQRSSISHILAGRNKPSFEILQKIIKRFPDVGFDWLMNDHEPPRVIAEVPSAKRGAKTGTRTTTPSNSKVNEVKSGDFVKKNFSEPVSIQPNLTAHEISLKTEKKVERILIFYSDQTFSEYKPV